MTSYTILAEQMQAAGIKNASPARARELAERSMYGQPMTEAEAALMAKWEAMSWKPDQRNVKKPGD